MLRFPFARRCKSPSVGFMFRKVGSCSRTKKLGQVASGLMPLCRIYFLSFLSRLDSTRSRKRGSDSRPDVLQFNISCDCGLCTSITRWCRRARKYRAARTNSARTNVEENNSRNNSAKEVLMNSINYRTFHKKKARKREIRRLLAMKGGRFAKGRESQSFLLSKDLSAREPRLCIPLRFL